MKETTEQLIADCRRGKRAAQLLLYKRYAQRLYATCLRITGRAEEAEEAMQDAFVKVFASLGSYLENTSFEAWMQRIAIHTAIDYVRRQQPDGVELADNLPEPCNDDEQEAEQQLQLAVSHIKAAIQQMPTGYRVVLSLYLFEGYDMEEIAAILHLRPASVRSQYLRARRKLLEQIEIKQHG